MIDVRNPSDGFKSLRARISELGPHAQRRPRRGRRSADRGRVGAAHRRGGRAPAAQHRGAVERRDTGRGRQGVRRHLRGRRRERPVRLGVPARAGRPSAHHRRLAVPRRVLPASGLRPASPVLRVRPRARPGAAHAGTAVVPALRRQAGQHRRDRRAVQGGPLLPARDHELAVEGTARHGVHPERAGHRSSTSTPSRWRASGSGPGTWCCAPGPGPPTRTCRASPPRASTTSPA